MKKLVLVFMVFWLMGSVCAQEAADTTYWKKGGNYALNFTQVSFTNWAAGGQNAIAGATKLKVFANYNRANASWENVLNMGYGLSKVQGLVLQKNDDLIDFQSKLGIKASEKWYYSGLFSLKSQFAPGYSDATNTVKISNFLAPAYLTLAFGMDYKPNDKFSMVLSPLTGKMTIVNDKDLDGMFGVEAGKTTRMELGASFNTTFTQEIFRNVGFASNLGLFTNYLDRPENIDVDWKLGLNMKVNSFLSASINTQMLFDADIVDPVDQKAKIQFKELLGIGFNITF
ncbi:MAG: DUF3078 domain-containing protein [Prolixibacteraceae bacterium]|nr:DUF3078 domain-containing protein [Prolixibacteraceae bacterium]